MIYILYQKYLKRQCHYDNVALAEDRKCVYHILKVHPVSSLAPLISGLHTFGRKQRFLWGNPKTRKPESGIRNGKSESGIGNRNPESETGTGNHKSQKTSSSNFRKLFCIAFAGKNKRL